MRRLVLVVASLTVPVWVAAVARAVLGVGLDGALIAGVLVACALVAWGLRRPRVAPFSPIAWIGALSVAAAFAALAVWRLWDPAVGGMSSSAGVDGIQHLQFSRSFATSQPGEYFGLVGLYAFHHAVQTVFDLDPFAAMRALLYASVLLVCAFPAAVILALRPARWTAVALTILTGASGLVVLEALHLPFLAYYQAHGFHTQLFGLVPLLAVAVGYAFSPGVWVRLAWFAVGLVLHRYTYVLHAGDLAVAATLLGWRELRPLRPRLAVLLLAAGVIASAYLYFRIWKIAFVYGGISGADERALLLCSAGITAVLAIAPWLAAKLGRPLADEAVRLTRFVALFTLAGALAQLAWLLAGQRETYFFHKYALHRTVLAGLTVIPIAAHLLVAAIAGRRWRWASPALLAVAVSAFALARGASGVDVYRPLYLERRSPHPRHFSRLVAEPAVMAAIHDVLRATGKRFGGLISPHKLESLEAGAAFGGPGLAFFVDPALAPSGSCVFWYPPSTLPARGLGGSAPGQAEIIAALAGKDDVVCRPHALALRPGSQGALCHRCLGGTSRRIPLQPVAGITLRHFSGLMNLGLWQFIRPLGRATIAFDHPAATDCRVSIWTQEDRPMTIALDGVPLTSVDGRRFPIGAIGAGPHELVLTSPPVIPGTPHRAQWGPQIRYLAIDCGEVIR